MAGSTPFPAVKTGRRVHVLFIVTEFGTGGSERLVLELSRSLDRREFEPAVVAFSGGELEKALSRHGIRTILIEKKPGIDISLMFKLSGIMRREKTDIVCTHHFMPLFYAFPGAVLRRNVRLVHTEHAEWELKNLGGWKPVAAFMMKHADATVGVSWRVTHCLGDRFKVPGDRIACIQNGVDLALFRNPSDKSVLKQRLGIDPGCHVIGMVGNLRPEKNHKFLIDAFRLLIRELPNCVLVLVGEGPLRRDLEQYAPELLMEKKLMLLGVRNDIPDIMHSFDVYCLPSLHEGLPMTLLEAMASSVPVVGTDVEGIRDLVQDGINGLLSPLGDSEKLASRLREVLQDESLGKKLVENGTVCVRNDHDLRRMVDRYAGLFQKVAGE